MKFVHTSDLHLGKRVNAYSMLEDQRYILNRIAEIMDEEKAEILLIAGDIYDKPVPPAEAVSLFDDFLVCLAEKGYKVMAISGNHDSPERISFASRLISHSGVWLSPAYTGKVEPVILADEYGEIAFYLLPFVKPAVVRHYFPEDRIENYTDALQTSISKMSPDPERRNVIVAHQFVVGAQRSGSEDIIVGGLDEVDAGVFSPFDYTALGHIHSSQRAGDEYIRYSGTPLKYSLSEISHEKSVTVVEMRKKGDIRMHPVSLVPLRNMEEYRGTYEELMKNGISGKYNTDAYVHLVLTDENEVVNAFSNLCAVYPNLMQMEYDNKRKKQTWEKERPYEENKLHPVELFSRFYKQQNHYMPDKEQTAYLQTLIEKIWNGGCE